jgi:hypothetical protein
MPTSTSLRGRVPGQLRIADIVGAQSRLPQRSLLARLFGINPIHPTMRANYRAALGELAVGEMLDQLGPKWDVLHVVPVTPIGFEFVDGVDAAGDDHTVRAQNHGDCLGMRIDHLVIGPPGVFALTAENYPGQEVRVSGDSMTIGGAEVDDLTAARRLSEAAAERLESAAHRPIRVEPIIVVIDSGKLVMREQPSDVTVVTARNLLRELTRAERSLAGSEVAYISDVADRTSTWDSAPTTPADALRLSEEFEALRREVRDAAQLRAFWGVVGFAVLCALAWAGTAVWVQQLLSH